MLHGWVRPVIFRRKIGKDTELFEKLLLTFKKLEDCIGQYDYWYAFLNQAKKIKLRKEVIQYIEENSFMALGAMEQIMKAEGLVVKNAEHGSVYLLHKASLLK